MFRVVPYTVPEIPDSVPSEILGRAFSGSFFEGKETALLEKKIAEFTGTRHAVTFASARAGLYYCYKFFECEGKEALLPAYACIPNADPARWAHAIPRFLDIDLGTYNMAFDASVKKLDNVGAVSLTYLYGLVGNLQPFLDYAKQNSVPVIEDAAIALGARYRKKAIGSLGDAGVFSFQDSKMLSSWRGCAVATGNKALYEYLSGIRAQQAFQGRAKVSFNLGFSFLRKKFSGPGAYALTMYPLKRAMTSRYLNPLLGSIMGFNPTEALDGASPEEMPAVDAARYSNIQASVALKSLRRMPWILKRRKQIALAVKDGLQGTKAELFSMPEGAEHSFGRIPLRVPGMDKFSLSGKLLKLGIETALNYPYVVPETMHMKKYRQAKAFRNAVVAARETVLLPMHTKLSDSDVERIVSAVKRIA